MKIIKFAAALTAVCALSASVAQAKCVVNHFADLPVTMHGIQPLVPAEINGVKVNFKLDSGAFFSLISRSAADRMKLSLEPTSSDFSLEGIGGEAETHLTKVATFTLAGVPLKNIPFLVASAGDSDVAGLLGQNVLGLGDVEYDLPHGKVRLFKPEDCWAFAMAYWAGGRGFSTISIHPPDDNDRHTKGEVYVNGKRLTAIFDTGADASILTRRAAERAGVNVNDRDVNAAGTIGGVGGGVVRTWIAPVASFKIGDEEIRNTKIRVGELNASLGADMLLGADFFISHRIWVSNAQRKLYFTYEGGPIFNIYGRAFERQADNSEKPVEVKPKEEEPTDADGYARRGAARQAAHDLTGALADFDIACSLAPSQAKYFLMRAEAHDANREPSLATADLDEALKLKPYDAEALILRAQFKLSGADRDGALDDLALASASLSPQSDQQMRIAGLYDRAERFDLAIAAYDKWLPAHPDHAQIRQALAGRCRARAMLGQDFDRALKDCDRALSMAANAAAVLDSRGLVHLRRGDTAAALADYDAALAINPKLGWSLYGRGLAKMRLSKTDDAKADLAAGLALNPKLKELFLKRGVAKDGEL